MKEPRKALLRNGATRREWIAGASVALFAEGPNPEWALPVPRAVPDPPPGLHRFAFDLEGLPQGASGEGAEIKLTAVSGDKAIEVEARLD